MELPRPLLVIVFSCCDICCFGSLFSSASSFAGSVLASAGRHSHFIGYLAVLGFISEDACGLGIGLYCCSVLPIGLRIRSRRHVRRLSHCLLQFCTLDGAFFCWQCQWRLLEHCRTWFGPVRLTVLCHSYHWLTTLSSSATSQYRALLLKLPMGLRSACITALFADVSVKC